ncbi:MAG: DUF4845 domain-containing protein [Gallionellales bacterium RIFCSPLOWO2_12_FULL_59_22]|nr:MAG: DUF4845 domain-containing protein [Gallionellales bacterium RIFCSPLOWO2_02_FULL_59_110]OGT05072.1 MAG: DUF4845 domain-containing protein [Gallionellales bacterium RIFCSPLOWO2_02_58_13]OGT12705.1 MAG: DUF4845 domain-containing protein [Gallionellales bacterium RIFCSPLOWO2_12_FULL_59_22]
MNTAMPSKQRGFSFSTFIFGAVILVFASIFGMKLIPVYMQDAQIKNILVLLANDPEMQNGSPRAILQSFSNRADIDNITAIKAEDIEIAKDGASLVLSASYDVKIPLAGNVSLYLEFNPSSDQ